MKNKLYLLLMLLAAAVATATAFADDDAATGPASEPVIVPYDVTKPVDSQNPDRVYIRYERFVQLWEAAKANKRGPQPEHLDQSYVLSSARYDAKLADGSLHVTGVIEVQTFNEGWATVPLDFKDVKLGVLKLDGQPAPLAEGGVAVEKAGHHRIEAEFDIPVGSNKTSISWGIPTTAGTLFSITLPDKQMKASVLPGDGVVERIDGDQKIVTAALGATDHIQLLLDSSVGLSTIKQAAVAKIDTALSITPAVELAHAAFEFSFPEAQQDHFTVSLDKALSLVKLDVPNLKSWKLTVGENIQTLDITLTEPARESFKFSIDAERTLAERDRHFPYISAAANRIEQTSALFSTPFLEVTPQPAAALRQISYPPEQDTGLRLVAAFSSTGDKESLAYGVQPAKASNKAEISYVYLVNHSKIELVAALKLRIKNATLFDVTVGLPGDFMVQAVESDRLKDWWREGDVLHARFKGNAPGAETTLVLHLVKLYKTTPDALEITPLTLPDTWEVEGNGIIAASTSVQAQMTLTGAKEINPQNAATDFRILPPMERKRGFSFEDQKFHASVKLETLPPRVDGTWVMSAQAHESWVSVSTHVNLSARQGSATGVSFRLPASTPEARITGDNVRETTSAVDGKWRVYQVAFQNDLTDETGFTVDFDLPVDGNVALPSFEFLPAAVERAEGFVIVDNASEYEMQVQPSGLETALSAQIPFLPLVSRNASLYRALPGWSLQINLTRLEKEAGRSAFVEYANLSTAIHADGSEWHRAVYHLQNRSLQFLPVALPEGSELASVSVTTEKAGEKTTENVRADRGKVDGKDVLLVPLIKTNVGDLPYDVTLVYRKTKTGNSWTFTHETLADPELVGISVEQTFWHLYVPEGSDASHFGGNMEQVLEEVYETEKQEGTLEEAKRLTDIESDTKNSLEVRQRAGENAKKLVESTLEENTLAAQGRGADYSSRAGTYSETQSKAVAVKQQEIEKGVEDVQMALEKNEDAQRAEQDHAIQLGAAVSQSEGQKSQTWAQNGSYKDVAKKTEMADKAKTIDRQNPQGGKQLYVNDYVMNVQGTGANTLAGNNEYAGNTTVNGGALVVNGANTYSGGTVIAAGDLPVAANAAATANNTVVLNGGADSGTLVQNQVMQIQSQQALQRQEGKAEAKGDQPPFTNVFGGGQMTSGLRSGGEAISQEKIDALLSPGTPTNPTSPAASAAPSANYGIPAQQNLNGNVTVLGDARANMDTNGPVFASPYQTQLQHPAQAATATTLDNGAAEVTVTGGNAVGFSGTLASTGEGMAGERQLRVTSRTGLGFGGTTFVAGNGQGQLVPAQLQPAGAISLPVDFPTSGMHEYHFKKLKANARLSFWITNGQSLDKWKWLVVFLVAAALMQIVFKCIDRGYFRVLRRRVVHI